MDSTFKVEITNLLADYLATSFQVARQVGLVARLHVNEEAQFLYLPNPDWMLLAGYYSAGLGVYLVAKYGAIGAVYKVEVLSQTAMVLLFRNGYFVAGQPVESNEHLVAFLREHRFPSPPCE